MQMPVVAGGVQAAELAASFAEALGPDSEVRMYDDGGFAVLAPHYAETVDRLAVDPIIKDMEANLQQMSDEEIASGDFMNAALHEYNRRGGKEGGHIGGPAEAIRKIRAERNGQAGVNVGDSQPSGGPDGTVSGTNRDPSRVAYETVTDPNASAQSLAEAMSSPNARIGDLAAVHPNLATEQRETIIESGGPLLSRLASNPSLTHDQIDAISGQGNRSANRSLAMNPACSREQIGEFLEGNVASSAARNPSISSAQLDFALDHDDELVRSAAAGNPACSEHHIDKAMKEGPLVRSSAMRNPSASADQVERGFKDRNIEVKCAASSHPKLSPERIAKNMTSKNKSIREWTAGNPALDESQINTMLDDPIRDVRRAAALNSSRTPANIAKIKADPEKMVSEMALVDVDD